MSQKTLFTPLLNLRKTELEKAISKAEQILKHPLQGCLEVNKKDNHFRYYIKSSNVSAKEKSTRKYIKDIDIAKALANRDYAKQVLKSATKELNQINTLIAIYGNTTADDCYHNLHPGRKLLVSPLLIDDEQYAKLWLSSRNPMQNTHPKKTPILTENNETVRSKSEKIIADKLYLSGIPYKYEEPLILEDTVKFPDFTVLNKNNRKTYYWEHLGMIDHPDYFKNMLTKVEIYFRNNIIPGKNLIITYETTNQPLSVNIINSLIEEYLL